MAYIFTMVKLTESPQVAFSLQNLVKLITESTPCCQSMTLAHLTSKNRNSTYVHISGDRFFYFYTLHYYKFFPTARIVKISILLLYNLGMRYRLSLLSIQSAQPLLRSDNLGLSQFLVSRKDTRSVSRYA